MLARVLGISGLVVLASVPLTLFLCNWSISWLALAKMAYGTSAVVFWLATSFRRIMAALRGRSFFCGGFGGLFGAMAVACVVLVNYMAHHNPHRWDLTKGQIFSLSARSHKVLGALESDVEVLAFYGPGHEGYDSIRDCLEAFRYASGHFDYRLIDPLERQDLVARYGISRSGPRIVILHGGGLGQAMPPGRRHAGPEEAITAGLARIVERGRPAEICMLTGHGEKHPGAEGPLNSLSMLAGDLQDEGWRTEDLSLLEHSRVPPTCRAVMLVGPKKDLTAGETAALDDYLAAGGRLMAFIGQTDSDSLKGMLRRWGIELGRGPLTTRHGRRQQYVTTDPASYPRRHMVFSRLAAGRAELSRLQAVFPFARPVERAADVPEGIEVVELAWSKKDAWVDVSPPPAGQPADFEDGIDRPGPVSLAIVASGTGSASLGERASHARLAVFGSASMVADSAYRVYPFNRNLVMNTLAWLVHAEDRITIRPRHREASLLFLDASQMKFIALFASDILPLLILAAGLSIWQIRRWS